MYRPAQLSVGAAINVFAISRRQMHYNCIVSGIHLGIDTTALIGVRAHAFSSFSSSSSLDQSSQSRPSSSTLSLDTAIYQNPEVVKGHLKSRGKSEELNMIDALLNLKESRNSLISKRNLLRKQKKKFKCKYWKADKRESK